MTTTPNNPTPDENDAKPPESASQDESAAQDEGAPGAEIGMTDDGSTFEPEEDPQGYS
jgi:hypothetical protein